MRWMSAIITACIIMVSLNTASAQVGDISDLKKLISANEDTYESFEKPDLKYDLKDSRQYFRSVQ